MTALKGSIMGAQDVLFSEYALRGGVAGEIE